MCARVWATGAARVGMKHMIKEFQQFIAKGNVMDMAVGIIIGAAFTAIVSALVGDLINPIIGLFTGGVVFLLVKMVNRVKAAASPPTPEAEEPKGPTQEELLAEIRDALKARAS